MTLLDALSPTTRTASEMLDTVLTYIRPYRWYALDGAVACMAIWYFLRWLHMSRQRFRTPRLQGPPSESFVYGVGMRTLDAEISGAIYEGWAQEYGSVYEVPSTLGARRIVLHDPKAISHLYAKDTWAYTQTPFLKESIAVFLGKGLMWADQENHRRQRKFLSPAFSVVAIRNLTSVFYELAYKAKGAWDVLIESSGGAGATIEIQNWMNHMSLDSIGLAGFSHDFGSLDGKRAFVTEVLDTFSSNPRSSALNKGLFLLGEAFPFLIWAPTPRTRLRLKLNEAFSDISGRLLARARRELGVGAIESKEKSIVGLLIKAADGKSELPLTKDEVTAQIRLLLSAGYEPCSIIMTWGLLELSRNPDVQTKLRNELLGHGADPTYDQLANDLPYLDAVVLETLRLHTPVSEVNRYSLQDDVIPLSEPIRTKSGELIDNLMVSKGTRVSISMESINRSTAIWGEDAKMFRPSRWIEDAQGHSGVPAKAKELQGHRHLLTFLDGPRICLGRHFAVTEFKVVLTVLIKNFVFELRDGVDSEIEMGRGVLPRPKLAGEVGCRLPLRVRPYVA